MLSILLETNRENSYVVTTAGAILGLHYNAGAMRVPEQKMLKVPEVAQRLDVSIETVRRWLRDGKLKGRMIGGQRSGYRIPESEIERLLSGEPEPA